MGHTLRFAAVGFGALLAAGIVASCGLGLDESRIDQVDADIPNDATFPDGPAPIDSGDGSMPVSLGGPCTKDDDCKSTNACLKGKCDLTRKACAYDVCKPQACSTATCDVNAKTCGPGKTHPYRAAQFSIAQGVGCGGAPSRCFAAVWPYLFVGTTTGVVAYAASDPANATPAEVPITGLGFVPAQILASGSRVYFLGAPSASATAGKVSLSYIDVPADPFVKTLAAKTVLAGYNRGNTVGIALAYKPGDSAYFLDVTTPSAASIDPPLVEPFNIATNPMMLTPPDAIAGVSGNRLAVWNINAAVNSIASFGLVTNIATATPTTVADQPLSTVGVVSTPQAFASGPDGALFWTVSSLTAAAATPGTLVRAAKSYFLLADSNAAAYDQANGLDIEVYQPIAPVGVGAGVIGPAVMLDAKTAMVTAATPQNIAQSSVQFIGKAPLGILKNMDNSLRRFVLPAPPTSLGVTTSNKIGYVLSVDSRGRDVGLRLRPRLRLELTRERGDRAVFAFARGDVDAFFVDGDGVRARE